MPLHTRQYRHHNYPTASGTRARRRCLSRCILFSVILLCSIDAAEIPVGNHENEGGSHWSFRKLVQPPVPASPHQAWVRNPIDAFLSVQHEKHGLIPQEAAAPHVLLRRIYMDLVGVPPTPEELADFTEQPTDGHYLKVVEDLLASPRYGERWGRHWMDVWRYSDWAGHNAEVRESQPHIWRWRDWIIESTNADKPYDRMIHEMLAADEIAPLDPAALRATGFLVRNWFRYNRNVWLENAVEHTGKAFLGLTMNCAKCHDHLYDPIPQTDFYRMRAFFEPHDIQTDLLSYEGDAAANSLVRVIDARPADLTYVFTRGNEATPDKNKLMQPGFPAFLALAAPEIKEVLLPVESYYPALRADAVKDALAKAEARVLESGKKEAVAWSAALALPALENADSLRAAADFASRDASRDRTALVALQQRILAERQKYGIIPGDPAPAARAAAAAERQAKLSAAEYAASEAEGTTHSLQTAAGQGDAKAKETLTEAEKKRTAAREALAAARKALTEESVTYEPLGPISPQNSTGRRLALAQWITAPENPLTARVAMNHVWMRHFGHPLVSSVFDFGKAGKAPSHPELLDWLAAEFINQKWSLKALHRLMVTSSAYRMKSSGGAMMASNEAKDPDNVQLWRMNVRRAEAEVVRDSVIYASGSMDFTMGGPELDQGAGESTLRRSVYFRHAKEKVMEFTQTLDGPGVSECYKRDESIVPQQALALANSGLVKNQSRRLAQSIMAKPGPDGDQTMNDAQFIDRAYNAVLSRPPSQEETAACLQFLKDQTALLVDPARLTPAAVGDTGGLPPAKEPSVRAKENLVLVLFNHNDFISIR